jgi:hypothetical protein
VRVKKLLKNWMIPWIGIMTLIGKYKVMTVNKSTPPPIPVAAERAEVKKENMIRMA